MVQLHDENESYLPSNNNPIAFGDGKPISSGYTSSSSTRLS